MNFDVVIVGAGPAGLSAAIRLKQQAKQNETDLRICVLEKGARVGAHTLSGAVLEPTALDELLPNWRQLDSPIQLPVKKDQFLWLTQNYAIPLPTPPQMHNQGNYIISLGLFCRFLAEQAEELGVEIYSGFAGSDILFNEQNAVIGIKTGHIGLDEEASVALLAKQTLFAEGCRGSLTKQLIQHYALDAEVAPQTYGLGIKEIWEVDSPLYQRGTVWHTVGYPLNQRTYGGSFVYHADMNQISLGLVVGLDYDNPYLDPFQELQRFKTHPKIRQLLQGGRRIAYGARSLSEGGTQSIPKLTFPGGCIIGDAAGFMNVPKIKGIHTAMKSGMIAAESLYPLLQNDLPHQECIAYDTAFRHSWLWKELHKVRNIRPGFHAGLLPGLMNAAFETYISRGLSPWTLTQKADYQYLKPAVQMKPIDYPKPDNILTFDKLSSVALTNTMHVEGQPCHLKLTHPEKAIDVNFREYASPETRYCPAGVYEIIHQNNQPHLQINSQNCIHCKACDIKDPTQNITWTPPQGGDGPNYTAM